RVMEYAVKFSDGKIVAIDSKMVGTDELERLHDEAIPEEERNARAANLVLKLRGKIDEVAGYIEPGRTLPFSIMAIPDSLVEHGANLIGEASKRNVIILGYSSVPPLIEYFFKIHSSYTIQQDVEAIFQSMMSAQQSLSRFTDSYFANRFLKPLQVLTRAVGELQEGVRKALQSVNVERGAPHQEEDPVEAIIP